MIVDRESAELWFDAQMIRLGKRATPEQVSEFLDLLAQEIDAGKGLESSRLVAFVEVVGK